MNYYHVDMLRYCDLLSSGYVEIVISYHVEMQILDTVIYSELLVIIEPRLQISTLLHWSCSCQRGDLDAWVGRRGNNILLLLI